MAEMLISWGGGGGGGVQVELWSGVVPRDRKSGEPVSLGMVHRLREIKEGMQYPDKRQNGLTGRAKQV